MPPRNAKKGVWDAGQIAQKVLGTHCQLLGLQKDWSSGTGQRVGVQAVVFWSNVRNGTTISD